MSNGEHLQKLAENIGKGDSAAMHKILGCAMTDQEAQFIMDLPAAPAELAAKWGMGEQAIQDRIMGLARRGLLIPSKKGMRFPADPATLHDGILSSASEHVPAGMDKFWMELYDGEGWGHEIGNVLSGLPVRILRTIPVLNSVSSGSKLPPHESITDIIMAHKDLISIRNCCCRVGAKKCDHPAQVCMQFSKRAQYDLHRGSGRKVSADEALSIALTAGDSGLVPTVPNMSSMEGIDFICFCCGCCCLVINPGLRVGGLDKILAPSRFVSTVDADVCNACGECVERCAVSAIEVQEDTGVAVVDRDKCLGCGACVLACPLDGGMTMELVRPPEFIPETNFSPTSIMGM